MNLHIHDDTCLIWYVCNFVFLIKNYRFLYQIFWRCWHGHFYLENSKANGKSVPSQDTC